MLSLIVPAFNEERRWSRSYWEQVSTLDGLGLTFVDDGSTDSTLNLIRAFCADSGHEVISHRRNRGKSEAIRFGLNHVLGGSRSSVALVGYLDADGAFPFSSIQAVTATAASVLRDEAIDAFWPARVQLAGRTIVRKRSRHVLGRAIASLLGQRVRPLPYDTQTGFKIFRNSNDLRACLAEPFLTRWFADVELLIRWQQNRGSEMRIWEEPVPAWYEIGGSHISGRETVRIMSDLVRLARITAGRTSIARGGS